MAIMLVLCRNKLCSKNNNKINNNKLSSRKVIEVYYREKDLWKIIPVVIIILVVVSRS